MAISGTIFNIQRFSVQDGPGIRTLVFFKGCPLRCQWCCNPESQAAGPSLLFNRRKCIGCGRCIAACPAGAITAGPEGNAIDRGKCTLCGGCAKVCYVGALEMAGEEKNVAEIMEEVLKDADIYRNSGGGVTLSGGEPTAQPGFAAAILKECRVLGIHTAVETCGFAPWDSFGAVLVYTDLVLFDIKHMDPAMHRELTGQDNGLILENVKRAVGEGKKVVVRLPLIPGLNTLPENIDGLGKLVKELGIAEAHLLPYHKLGVGKYSTIGADYRIKDVGALPESDLESIEGKLENLGLKVIVYSH